MALTKTTDVLSITVIPADSRRPHATISVHYVDAWDDPDDSELPLKRSRTVNISRYQEDGTTPTDISSREQVIKDIAAALWT
jgi:hypothetical protein